MKAWTPIAPAENAAHIAAGGRICANALMFILGTSSVLAFIGNNRKEMYQEGITEYRKADEISPAGSGTVGLGHAYAMSGDKKEAQRTLDDLKKRAERNQVRPSTVAIVYARLNDADHAFEWMAKAREQHAEGVVYLKAQPYFDNLRSDPRPEVFLERIGLQKNGCDRPLIPVNSP